MKQNFNYSTLPNGDHVRNSVLIKNGTVYTFDGTTPIVADVLVSNGIISSIGSNLTAAHTIDATGQIVTPALIDIHTHIYHGATSLGVPHAKIAQESVVGTFVDAGSAGGGNIDGLDEFIRKPSAQNIFAFVNISFPGIFGFSKNVMVGEAENLKLLNKTDCIEAVKRHPELIVGIKVRAGRMAAGENGEKALHIALEVAEELSLPIMCHVDFSPPGIEDILRVLQKGDILTHCCRPDPNSIVDQGVVLDAAWRAKERGIFFDIGHGMGGFSFEVCRKMLAEGFQPDMISSDVHCLSVNGPAVDLLTTINKLIAIGVPLERALQSSTEIPSKSMRRDSLGRIRVGDTANISILKHSDSPQIFTDAMGETLTSSNCLAPVALISKGKITHSNTTHMYEV